MSPDDVGKKLRIKVVAHNRNATASTPAFSLMTQIPPAPTNTAIPQIRKGSPSGPNASATPIGTGDELFATTGTWTDASATGYSYKWLRCDTPGSCTPIDGTTSSQYRVKGLDDNKTFRVDVTASNNNIAVTTTSSSLETVPVTPAALAPQPATAVPERPRSAIASDGRAPTTSVAARHRRTRRRRRWRYRYERDHYRHGYARVAFRSHHGRSGSSSDS